MLFKVVIPERFQMRLKPSLLAMIFHKQGNGIVALSVAPPLWKGTFLFVGLMVAGLGCMDAGLIILANRVKKRSAIVFFVVSFICSMAMGYLSSRDFAQASMNWIAEGINIVGQGCLLAGVWMLHKAGLAEYKIPRN